MTFARVMNEHEIAAFDVRNGGCLVRCGCGWTSEVLATRSELLDRWGDHLARAAARELEESRTD